MKRTTSSPWLSRIVLAVLAAVPAFACVSGEADSLDGPQTPQAGTGIISQAGSTTVVGGSGPATTGGSQSSAGTTSVAGTSSPQGGSSGVAGSTSAGGAGGTTPVETCSYPAWQAGKDYAKGDKVMYMGKAFVANEPNPGYDPIISTYFWSPYDCQSTGTGGSTGAGGSGPIVNNGDCVLDKYLPQGETTFHAMFIPPWQGHVEKPLYSYTALCTALKGFGQFANSGNAEQDKREIAAFFAHVSKETAFLEQTDEAGQPSNAGDFHGRGAIQLTGQANYQAAGEYLQKNLVGNPGLVSTDPVTNWQTALWFWVVHNNPGTQGVQNCHTAISAGDFAQTTRIINGGIECPGSASAATRAEYFKTNCSLMSVSPGNSLVC